MKNCIFISPNFPTNYWQFCRELKNNGMNVLGIGDQPYDELTADLKGSLNEYYKVSSLENEDEVYRAVAFFIFKHGRIDWLESNNEYWLERDAKLRTDFNITSGFQVSDIPRIKYKSRMKEFYIKAGIPVARHHLVDTLEGCLEFIKKVDYPVIAKPDNGVGASHTYKLSYIMEEFVDAEVNSYDAIIDANGEPVFETGNVTPNSIMDIVNNADNSIYYIVKSLKPDVKKAGRATVKTFGHSTVPVGKHAFCAFAGLRDGKDFVMSHQDIMDKYGEHMKMVDRIPDVLAGAMGNQMYVAVFDTEKQMRSFYEHVLKCR